MSFNKQTSTESEALKSNGNNLLLLAGVFVTVLAIIIGLYMIMNRDSIEKKDPLHVIVESRYQFMVEHFSKEKQYTVKMGTPLILPGMKEEIIYTGLNRTIDGSCHFLPRLNPNDPPGKYDGMLSFTRLQRVPNDREQRFGYVNFLADNIPVILVVFKANESELTYSILPLQLPTPQTQPADDQAPGNPDRPGR